MSESKHVLVIVRVDVAPEMEEELNRFYDEEHIPLLLKAPGVLWAKRGINVGSGPKYIAVYEHENINVKESDAYKKAVETEWALRMRPHLLNFQREIYELFD